MIIAPYDIETDGLLPQLTQVHCIGILLRDTSGANPDRRISAADQKGYSIGDAHYYIPGEEDPETNLPVQHPCKVGDKIPEGATLWERMPLLDALKLLAEADIRVGHNIQDFDERAILKVYPWWKPKKGSKIVDTLLLSRLTFPDIHRTGPNGHRLFPFEKRLHNLASWGKRLGRHKLDYTDWCKREGIEPWEKWRPEMQAYMDSGDVEVSDLLFKYLWSKKPATTAVDLEHEFASIIRRLESRGWAFDSEKAERLLEDLQAKEASLEEELIGSFGSFYLPVKRGGAKPSDSAKFKAQLDEDEDEEDEVVQATRLEAFYKALGEKYIVIPTKDRAVKTVGQPDIRKARYSEKTGKRLKDYVGPPKTEYTQGHPYTPVKLVQFNPSSRSHIWQRLIHKYGWVPSKLTPGGKNKDPEPVVDEEVLSGLPYGEAMMLAEYFLVLKRIGQLATGQKAWLKMAVEYEAPNGYTTYRIHGRINTNGAATGRCTHSNPNLAQVPKNSAGQKDYSNSPELHGHRCRELFITSPGMVLAGFDGSGLELRMLAHYLTPWDKGEYSEIVVNGKKEDRSDPHSWLAELIGVDLLGNGDFDTARDNAKTVMYATLYGAGNLKRGSIVIPRGTDKEKMDLGREINARMEHRFEAKAHLGGAIEEAVQAQGFLKGIDGRKLYTRKVHAALNTLLQSAGAVVMKKALVILDRDLQKHGMKPGIDYEFVGNIHDEAQAEILPENKELYKKLALDCLPKAGRSLGLLCPLASECDFGSSWKDTH